MVDFLASCPQGLGSILRSAASWVTLDQLLHFPPQFPQLHMGIKMSVLQPFHEDSIHLANIMLRNTTRNTTNNIKHSWELGI